jgi:hypothetical protein
LPVITSVRGSEDDLDLAAAASERRPFGGARLLSVEDGLAAFGPVSTEVGDVHHGLVLPDSQR